VARRRGEDGFATSTSAGSERVTTCPRCGAGNVIVDPRRPTCHACGRTLPIEPAPPPASEQERLARLRERATRGARDPRFDVGALLSELELNNTSFAHSLPTLRSRWRADRAALAKKSGKKRGKKAEVAVEQRFALCAVLYSGGAGALGDPERRERVLLDSLELIEDVELADLLRYELARCCANRDDIAEAERWISRCDPGPTTLELHMQRTATIASVRHSAGEPERALDALGRQPDDPLAGAPFGELAAQLRVAALEEVGDDDAALAALDHACAAYGAHLVTAWLRANKLGTKTLARWSRLPGAWRDPS
jgi:hypothetical protein